MFIKENLNPKNKIVGDCVIRGISTLLNQDWGTTYIGLAVQGYIDADLPSSDSVWNNYLFHKGYTRQIVPSVCPDCITVSEFTKKYKGRYLLFVGGHVVACVNGDYYDTWDSGDRVVIYFFEKKQNDEY